MTKQTVWTETKQGTDGQQYSVRYLHDDDELTALQAAGIIGSVYQVVGMQDVADLLVADMEMQLYTASGGVVQ